MAPNLANLPAEIIEIITLYLLPEDETSYLHEYKTSSIFNFRLASAQLSIKSRHAFAKKYFSSRIYHGLLGELERLALVARNQSLHSYVKSITIILQHSSVGFQLQDSVVVEALSSLPNLERLDLLTTWTDRLSGCPTLNPDLHLPRLKRFYAGNVAFDIDDAVRLLEKHPSIVSFDLRDARPLSGSFEAFLNAASSMPNLRELALSRRLEGRDATRRLTYPFPERYDLYSAEEAGTYLVEQGLDVRLGSTRCRIVASSWERMRDGVGFVLRKHYECMHTSNKQFLAQLSQVFPSFGAAESQNFSAALESQRSGASCQRNVQIHYGGARSMALMPH